MFFFLWSALNRHRYRNPLRSLRLRYENQGKEGAKYYKKDWKSCGSRPAPSHKPHYTEKDFVRTVP